MGDYLQSSRDINPHFHQRSGNFDSNILSASPIGSSPSRFHIRIYHDFYQVPEFDHRFPAKYLLRFFRICDKYFNFGRAEIFWIDPYMFFCVKSRVRECFMQELADRWVSPVPITKSSGFSCCRIRHMHSTYSGANPQSRFASRFPRYRNLSFPFKDPCNGTGDLAGDKCLSPSWGFMVEQNTV